MGDLYAFYEALLTERQRQIIEMYHFDDLSLGEIGQALDISRQAVHDQLRRAGEQLEAYEAALHLREIASRQREAWAMLTESLARLQAYIPETERRQLQERLDRMTETLSSLTGGEANA
ncbi:YlxM family DNA-binding protein [Alicyclobacillus acidiphilus]|uniref:YlxM family DNA-binding protein n=1 Tax=Alicyclobacillus acidiphilus TaxID=182455 RepID=UPI000ADEF5ED|nr:sigma factor-like helix-turn-helix DNA-binding protein [Alicyclobacillus acidiphilus]